MIYFNISHDRVYKKNSTIYESKYFINILIMMLNYFMYIYIQIYIYNYLLEYILNMNKNHQ